jgi:hypothetical protein
MKTSSKSLITFAIVSLFTAGLVFAAADKAAPAAKVAPCCTKAQKEGKACTHECCVKAAKNGDNCAKCKGAGKIADVKK